MIALHMPRAAAGLEEAQAKSAAHLRDLPGQPGLAGATAVVTRHATIRSVWFPNSVRASLALAAAVAVADLSIV
jgi:hypothetical protein